MIPVAFAFDNALTMPAAVAISSLMRAAKPETKYHVFVLHSAHEKLDKEVLDKVVEAYPDRLKLTYREVGNDFDGAFEIRGITTPAYYRLLIPELIPEYDKVIYSDVDVIFRNDFSEVYEKVENGDWCFAGVNSLAYLDKEQNNYFVKNHMNPNRIIYSGNLIINSDEIRKRGLIKAFKKLSTKDWKFQDMDIINVACEDSINLLPLWFCMTNYMYQYDLFNVSELLKHWTAEDIDYALKYGTVHYNGRKPWQGYCPNFDIWWEEYRKSPVFDREFYFKFFYNRLEEQDTLPLMKRMKGLVRYFVYGRKKLI